jgi:DNA-directed RNA polymerase subunit RPC12/RpoP
MSKPKCSTCGKRVTDGKYLSKIHGECFECSFKRILHDPKIQTKAEHFAKVAGYISPEDLNKPFTR